MITILTVDDDPHILELLRFYNMSELGYAFYLIDENGNKTHYGIKLDNDNLDQDKINAVLDGHTYHGIANYPWKLFITGFFSNELKNTVGVPIEVSGKHQALFVRANTQLQFGEMRVFLAVLLVLVLLISFLLVLLSTRYIVKPVHVLTEATKKIAGGNYHLKLPVKRHDKIGDLAKHFSRMSNSLEEVEEKRQEFVSNVSHEIQSPLTSIQGFSKTLRMDESVYKCHSVHEHRWNHNDSGKHGKDRCSSAIF